MGTCKKIFNNKKSASMSNFYIETTAAQKLQGKVSSVSMDKTVSVTVNRLLEHSIYRKRSKVSKTYLAHVEESLCKRGDEVELQPCRPLSKRKRFTVSRVIKSTLVQ